MKRLALYALQQRGAAVSFIYLTCSLYDYLQSIYESKLLSVIDLELNVFLHLLGTGKNLASIEQDVCSLRAGYLSATL